MKEIEVGTRVKLHSYSDFAKVKCSDGRWALYKGNKNLSTIYNFTFDDIEAFDYNLDYFKVRLGSHWGVIEKKGGQEIIPCRYDKIESFILDYFIVHVKVPENNTLSYMGIVDKCGRIIYKPCLIDITIIEDDDNEDRLLCFVKNYKGEKSFVDLKDKHITRLNVHFFYDIIKEKHEKNTIYQIIVKQDDDSKTVGYIGADNRIIIPPIFEYISFLGDNFYAYKTKHALTGVFDKTHFKKASDYENYIKCEKQFYNNGDEQIDRNHMHLYKSALLIAPIYKNINYENSFFRAVLEVNKYYIFSKTGEEIIHISNGHLFDKDMCEINSEVFYLKDEKYLKFSLSGKKGLISPIGSIIIPPQYDDFEILNEINNKFYFKVKLNDQYYGIYGDNKQLCPTFALPYIFDEIIPDTYRIINQNIKGWIIKKKNLYGVIYHDGSCIEPDYHSLKCNKYNQYIVEQNGKFGIINITPNYSNIITEVIYDSMDFNDTEIYGRIGRQLFIFTKDINNKFIVKSSYIVEDLSQGYSNNNLNLFIGDRIKTNILTIKEEI